MEYKLWNFKRWTHPPPIFLFFFGSHRKKRREITVEKHEARKTRKIKRVKNIRSDHLIGARGGRKCHLIWWTRINFQALDPCLQLRTPDRHESSLPPTVCDGVCVCVTAITFGSSWWCWQVNLRILTDAHYMRSYSAKAVCYSSKLCAWTCIVLNRNIKSPLMLLLQIHHFKMNEIKKTYVVILMFSQHKITLLFFKSELKTKKNLFLKKSMFLSFNYNL